MALNLHNGGEDGRNTNVFWADWLGPWGWVAPPGPQPIPIKAEVPSKDRPATWLVIDSSTWGPREDLEDLQIFWATQIIGQAHDLDPVGDHPFSETYSACPRIAMPNGSVNSPGSVDLRSSSYVGSASQ